MNEITIFVNILLENQKINFTSNCISIVQKVLKKFEKKSLIEMNFNNRSNFLTRSAL